MKVVHGRDGSPAEQRCPTFAHVATPLGTTRRLEPLALGEYPHGSDCPA